MNFLVIINELTMAAAKIFVEPQDDVVSIAARISRAEADQVVVVIPNGANIVASEVSVKLLARVITTISKLVVFVTDDILAQKYVIRSNMVAIEKVSDVNRETWQSALSLKQNQIQKKDERKSELIKSREVETPQTEFNQSDTEEKSLEVIDQKDTQKDTQNNMEVDVNFEAEKEESQKIVIGLDGNQEEGNVESVDSDLKMPKISVDPAAVAPVAEPIKTENIESNDFGSSKTEEVTPLFKKMSAKIIDLDSYALLSGGDIIGDQLGSTLRNKLNNLQKLKKNNRIINTEKVDVEVDETDELAKTDELEKADELEKVEENNKFPDKNQYQKLEHNPKNDSNEPSLLDKSQDIAKVSLVRAKSQIGNIVGVVKAKYKSFVNDRKSKNSSRLGNRAIEKESVQTPPKPSSNYSSNSFTNVNLKNTDKVRNLGSRRKTISPKSRRIRGSNMDGGPIQKVISAVTSIAIFQPQFWQSSFQYLIANPQQLGIGFAVIGIVVVMAVFTLGPSASIQVVVARQSLPIVATISASTDISAVDNATMTMPMYVLDRTESRSETAPATGTKEVGERATTTVTISNDNNNPVTLASGTTLGLAGRDINYRLTQDITIPSAQRSTNVPVEAVDIGEQFNVNNNSYKTFSIAQDKVSAFTYSPIRGGSSEERVAVTQADIDGISEQLVGVLENALSTELSGLISQAERQLGSGITFGDPKISASRQVGEVADTVDVTVELTAKVHTIRVSDLSLIAETVAKQNGNFSGDFVIDDLADIDFTVSDLTDTSATIELNTNASLSANVTSEQIEGSVLGMSVSNAENELQNIPDTLTSELEYSPRILPKFMARVPSNPDKVDVQIVKSSEE